VARYLLLQMLPGHITGGPALFNMLNEFFRQFPELKIALRKNLRTLISIGAPYNVSTAKQLKSALGIDLLNAFGTTETQMVLLNKNSNGVYDPETLGSPLPGVSIGLKKTEEEEIYELHINSPYQSSYVMGESNSEKYFSSGDLVSLDDSGTLRYELRKGTDFIKDGFGVKVPVDILKEYYPFLYKISTHIQWIPLDNKPGLAVLIFLHPSFYHYDLKQLGEKVKSQNEILQSIIEPFEFSHRHIERISIEKNEFSITRKGTFSNNIFLKRFEEIITILKNPYASDSRVESFLRTLFLPALTQTGSTQNCNCLISILPLYDHPDKMEDYYQYCHPGTHCKEYFLQTDKAVSLRVIHFKPNCVPRYPPVVMIGGLATFIESFQGIIGDLTRDFEILYVETREKKSSRITGSADFNIETVAHDIVSVIKSLKLTHQHYILFGYSYGATVIVEAYRHLDVKPLSLLLLSPTPSFYYPRWSLSLIRVSVPLYPAIKQTAKWYLRNFVINSKEDNEMYRFTSYALDNADPRKLKN